MAVRYRRRKPLPLPEAHRLIGRWQEHRDRAALQLLIETHCGWIHKVVGGWLAVESRAVVDDLWQEALLGFIRAVELYQPGKAAFLGYSKLHMDAKIRRYRAQDDVVGLCGLGTHAEGGPYSKVVRPLMPRRLRWRGVAYGFPRSTVSTEPSPADAVAVRDRWRVAAWILRLPPGSPVRQDLLFQAHFVHGGRHGMLKLVGEERGCSRENIRQQVNAAYADVRQEVERNAELREACRSCLDFRPIGQELPARRQRCLSEDQQHLQAYTRAAHKVAQPGALRKTKAVWDALHRGEV